MAETFLEEIIRYVKFGDEHRSALRALHDHAQPSFESMCDRFYERLERHHFAVEVFKSSAQVERLKVSLRNWLATLLSGPWDAEYHRRRSRIGRMHVKVDLPQRYMLTAMNHVRDMLHEVARDSYGEGSEMCLAVASIDKVCDLELAIMLETYREDSIESVTRVQKLERDVLQRRLRVTEARYQAIVETAEVLVVAAEPAGNVVLFNRKAEESTGIDRSEVAGLEVLYEAFSDQDAGVFRAALERALSGASVAPFTSRMYSRSGDELSVRWHVATLASSDEPYACAIGVDQTEERLLEEEARRSERLASLGTLAAGLAHEIRNPLNAALLQLLLVERRVAKVDDPKAEGAVAAAAVVRDELSRLGVLVEDFLAFARPTKLRLSSQDLLSTVESVVALMQPDAQSSGIELALVDREQVAARFDGERIRQVLLNLIRNGIEAAGDGGRVEVQALRDRGRAVIEVRDTGDGPPEGLDLFQPFETSKDTGTGLGLSIVYRIVTEHGGTIGFSRRDGMTRFRVELPIDGPG